MKTVQKNAVIKYLGILSRCFGKNCRGGVVIGEEAAAKSLETIRKEKEASIKAEESLKADQALLKTFSSTEDLILARDRKVDQIDQEIILLESRIIKLEENLQKVRLRIDANEKESLPVMTI